MRMFLLVFFFFSSRRRHTRCSRDWSSDVCSSDLKNPDSLLIVEWTNQEFPEGVSNINGDFSRISGGWVQASSVGANLYRKLDRKSTRLNSSHGYISYAVFCLKKKNINSAVHPI